MTVQEIANRLVELCRKGEYQTCYKELYAEDAWSIEPEGAPTPPVQGMEAFAAKGKAWNETIQEFHSSSIGDPIVSGNHFAMPMSMNCTFKGAPGPTNFEELCVYEVQNGKIVKEQFFYQPAMDPTEA